MFREEYTVGKRSLTFPAGRVKIPRLKKGRVIHNHGSSPSCSLTFGEKMYAAMFKHPLVTVLCLATIASAGSLADCKL